MRSAMAKLRQPRKGEKIKLIRRLLREFPEKGNIELVPIFNEKAREMGLDMTTLESGQEFASARYHLKKAGDRPSVRQEPSAGELLRVKELAEQFGGLAELIERVQQVEKMAEQVGGMDRLKACLEFWAKIEVGG